MVYGGLLLAATMDDDARKARYLKSLFDEMYFIDVMARNRIEKTQELEDLVDVLASAVGSLTNPSRTAATFDAVLHSQMNALRKKGDCPKLSECFPLRSPPFPKTRFVAISDSGRWSFP